MRWTLLIASLLVAPLASARDAWLLVDIDGSQPLSHEQRTAIAKDLGARLAVIRSVVPKQSAKQKREVEVRLAAMEEESLGSSARGRFFLSVDYQHYQLLELLQQASDRLDCIYRAQSVPREMFCWSALAEIYLAEERIELGMSSLRRMKMVPRDDDMPRVAQDPRVWYTEFGRGIVRGIVTPYLKHASESGSENGSEKG